MANSSVVSMKALLEAGVHFGHQTRRWNPKMKQYILMERNGIHIINLFKSLELIDKAYDFIKATVAHNGTVLFVGTKKQAQEAVQTQATRVNMPYVSERWLGGMLTNFQTVSKRVSRLKELEEMDFSDVHGSGLTKKELLLLERSGRAAKAEGETEAEQPMAAWEKELLTEGASAEAAPAAEAEEAKAE